MRAGGGEEQPRLKLCPGLSLLSHQEQNPSSAAGTAKLWPLGTGRILQQLGEGSDSSQHQHGPTHLPKPPTAPKITKGLLVMRKGNRSSRRTLRNPTGWGALLLRETQEHKPGQQGRESRSRNSRKGHGPARFTGPASAASVFQ